MCCGDQSRLWLGLFLFLEQVRGSHQGVNASLDKSLSIHTIWMKKILQMSREGGKYAKRWEPMRGIGVKKGAIGIRSTRKIMELYVWVSSKGP